MAGATKALAINLGISPWILAAFGMAELNDFAGAVKIMFLATIAFRATGVVQGFFVKNMDHLLTDEIIRKLHGHDFDTVTEALTVEHQEKIVQLDIRV